MKVGNMGLFVWSEILNGRLRLNMLNICNNFWWRLRLFKNGLVTKDAQIVQDMRSCNLLWDFEWKTKIMENKNRNKICTDCVTTVDEDWDYSQMNW